MRPNKLVMLNLGPFVGRTEIDFDRLDDIFLITGKTGAGKTTVFDALCFALYGTLPGSRRGTVAHLRSDYSGEDDECHVSLEFSLGSQRYRVDRSPKQDKKKKRGTGFTTVDETALLYEWTGSEFEPRSSRKSEADEKIRRLIGLSPEEFVKIVLLPQGEFAEFLRQNTTERREVLRKLFPVDAAVRVRELAQAKARDAGARLAEAERSLAELADRVPAETAEAAREAAHRELEAAKERTRRAADELARTAEALRLAEAQQAALRRLEGLDREEADLRNREPEFRRQESLLARSRLAHPLAHLVDRAEAGRKAALAAAQTLSAAETLRKERAAAVLALAAGQEEIRNGEREAERLRGLRGPLEAATAEENGLTELGGQRESLGRRLAELEEAIRNAQARAAQAAAEQQTLEASAAGADTLDTELEQLRAGLESLRGMLGLAEKAAALRGERGRLQLLLDQTAREAADLEKSLPVLEVEVRTLGNRKTEQEDAVGAARLAIKLRAGEPCPVCGAREHPAPAAAPPPEYGLTERLEALVKTKAAAERDLSARQAELAARRREAARLERDAGELSVPYREALARLPGADQAALAAALPDPEALPEAAPVAEVLRRTALAATETAARRDAAVRARARLAVLFREGEAAARHRTTLEADRAGAAERLRGLETAYAEKSRRLKALLTEWNTDTILAAREQLERRAAELAAALAAHEESRTKLAREESAALTREEVTRQALAAALAEEQVAVAALGGALADSVFADAGEIGAALLDAATEARLEKQVGDWKEGLHRLQSSRREVEQARDQLVQDRRGASATPEELRRELEAREAERKTAEEDRDRAAAALAGLMKEQAAYREAAERRRSLAREAGELKTLADDLSGNNPKRRGFDAWLLGLYLQEVAVYATRRLERMSEGRYALVLNAEGDGGRGYAGLDLAVFDAFTGKARPCATLSGGESFMAAISLALGLADSIQSRSGGVRLDAVFIDEGFGSLDDASLDRALGILDEIRDHRMVGLISHVGDLRSRIPSRIDVEKTAAGSRIVM